MNMKKTKKIISVLLAVIMLAGIMPINAFATADANETNVSMNNEAPVDNNEANGAEENAMDDLYQQSEQVSDILPSSDESLGDVSDVEDNNAEDNNDEDNNGEDNNDNYIQYDANDIFSMYIRKTDAVEESLYIFSEGENSINFVRNAENSDETEHLADVSINFGSEENAIPFAAAIGADEEQMPEWVKTYGEISSYLTHYFVIDTDKSVVDLIRDDVLQDLGLSDVNAAFGYQFFTLGQDERHIADYVLFFIQDSDTGLLSVVLFELDSSIDVNDFLFLMKQYETNNGAFIVSEEDSSEWTQENLQILRDVIRESMTCIYRGKMLAGKELNATVDLLGPQYIETEPIPTPPIEENEEIEEIDNIIGASDALGLEDNAPQNTDIPQIQNDEFENPTQDANNSLNDTDIQPNIEQDITQQDDDVMILQQGEQDLLIKDELLNETINLIDVGMETSDGEQGRGAAPAKRGGQSEEPTVVDGLYIDKPVMEWLTESDGSSSPAGTGVLEMAPSNDKLRNQQWQLTFGLEGSGKIAPGDIEIVIPAYIWIDRNGKEPGRHTLAVPEEPDTSKDFAWRRLGDTIVITNTRAKQAGSRILIQGTFRMTYPDPNSDIEFQTEEAHEMYDKDIQNIGETLYSGISKDMFAVINVVTPNTGELLSVTTNKIYATLDTKIEPASAIIQTALQDVSKTVPDDMPSNFLPSNPNAYYYMKWAVTASAKGNQPYQMTFHIDAPRTAKKYEDSSSDPIEIPINAKILGVTGTWNGDIKAANPNSLTGVLFNGYTRTAKTAYVWIAYPKSDFDGNAYSYRLESNFSTSVTGVDDGIETSMVSNTSSISFRIPSAWSIGVIWDDNNNEHGIRPESVTAGFYNYLNYYAGSFSLSQGTNWFGSWVDDGKYTSYRPHVNYCNKVGDTFSSRSTSTLYYPDGHSSYMTYGYKISKIEKDPNSKTWYFTCTYYEATKTSYSTTFSIDKITENRNDSDLKSTYDKDLNYLRAGQNTQSIVFHLYGYARVLNETMELGGNLSDPDSYGKRFVNVTLEDTEITHKGSKLLKGEYEIKYVLPSAPSVTNWQLDYGAKNGEGTTVNAGYVSGDVYGSDGTSWTLYGTKTQNSLQAYNGARVSDDKLMLPSGVLYVRYSSRINNASISMSYSIGVQLKSTQAFRDEIEEEFRNSDYIMWSFTNKGECKITDADGNKIRSGSDSSDAYLHGRNGSLEVNLAKSSTFYKNDRISQNLIVSNSISVSQKSNLTTFEDYRDAINAGVINPSESGTFYDLIPPGMTALLDTVTIDKGKIVSAYIISNFRKSGQQLLVIKAELGSALDAVSSGSGSTYGKDNTITFDIAYGYDEAMSRGLTGIRNYAIYEADEPTFGNADGKMGEPDNPTAGNHNNSTLAVSDTKMVNLLTNIDEDRDDPVFLYASSKMVFTELDSFADTFIDKRVRTTGELQWSYGYDNDVVVEEGKSYTYMLKVTSGSDTTSSDIIMLDKIESYQLKKTDDDYNASGQWSWKGKLESVDVSEIISLGIEPIIYYSTNENIDLGQYNTEQNSESVATLLQGQDWTTNAPDDLGDVAAIAIDCRYDADGNKVKLREHQSVIAYLNMIAPNFDEHPEYFGNEKYDDVNNNAHAYNDFYVDVTQIADEGESNHVYKQFKYTKTCIMSHDLTVKVTWNDANDNDRVRPEDVSVTLIQNGQATDQKIQITADDNWEGYFMHVPKYDDRGREYRYSVSVEARENYSFDIASGESMFVVNGKHDLFTTEVPVLKVWTSEEPDGWENNLTDCVTVKLLVDGVYLGKYIKIRQSLNGDWRGVFSDLQKYKDGREIEYTIEEVPVPDCYSEVDGYTITNHYMPYGNLAVYNRVENATERALDQSFTFAFELYSKSNPELPDIGEYPYEIKNANGEVVQDGKIHSGDEFQLKNGWNIYIISLPSGATYSISEKSVPGFLISSEEKTNGTIIATNTIEASFVNRYKTYGQASLSAFKTLSGKSLERYQFKFAVKDLFDNTIKTGSNKDDGSVAFGEIRYSNNDDGRLFAYIISENNSQKNGYEYDETSYIAFVTPNDLGNGKMACDVTYYQLDNSINLINCSACEGSGVLTVSQLDGTTKVQTCEACAGSGIVDYETDSVPCELPEFNNTYTASGTLLLKAWKTLDQRALQNNEFTFIVTKIEDGVVSAVRRVKNDENGVINIANETFTQNDIGRTFFYVVKEENTGDITVNYDESQYAYRVDVSDNGDGTLSTNVSRVQADDMIADCEQCDGIGYEGVEDFDITPTFTVNEALQTITVNIASIDNMALSEHAFGLMGLEKNGRIVDMQQFAFGTGSQTGEIIFEQSNGYEVSFQNAYNNGNRLFIEIVDEQPGNEVWYLLATKIPSIESLNDEEDFQSMTSTDSVIYMPNEPYCISRRELCSICYGATQILNPMWIEAPGEMPVFRNTLKDGSLSITKNITESDNGSVDTEQKFTFKVKISGTNLEDGQAIEYSIVD